MFTGIIEELGRMKQRVACQGAWRLEIAARQLFDNVTIGESVAVNGVCLTAVEGGGGWCAFEVGPETLNVTTLEELSPNDPVNLERPLRMGGLVGGHLVSGHIDGIGTVRWLNAEADTVRMTIELSTPELGRYLIQKGSVAVDGVSLTVAQLHDDSSFDVMIIPHTLRVTTLGVKREGSRVNLEMDMIGKYVHRLFAKMGDSERWDAWGGSFRADSTRPL